MLPSNQLRRVEALQHDGTWCACDIGALEIGDVFRTSEPDGTPVLNAHGRREYRVIDMPRVHVESLEGEPDLDRLPRHPASAAENRP